MEVFILENKHSLNFSNMPVELRLILCCLRVSADQDAGKQIEALSRRVMDWDAFIGLVNRHRVPSLVYNNLKRFTGNSIPEIVRTRLKNCFHRNAQQVLAKTAELMRIVKKFNQNNIPVLPLKGPVLALQVFGDVGLRHVGDLDIMVPAECVKKAENLMLQEGYRRTYPGFDLTPRQHSYYTLHSKHSEFYNQDRRISVELHWRLCSNPYLFPLQFDAIWKDRQTVRLAGADVAALSLEHTILFLCVHGATHAWFKLFWLNDIARLLQKYQTIDWSKLMVHAARLGVRRMVAEGVILANLLLDSPLPGQVRVYAEKDKAVYSLARMALYLIRHPGGPSYRPFTPAFFYSKLYQSMLRGNQQYKLSFFLAQIGADCDDWERVPLPDTLFPFYYLVRPLFWFFSRYVPKIKVERRMGRRNGVA